MFERAIHHELDFVPVERFLDIVVGPQLHGFDGRVDRGKRGHQHDGHIRAQPPSLR